MTGRGGGQKNSSGGYLGGGGPRAVITDVFKQIGLNMFCLLRNVFFLKKFGFSPNFKSMGPAEIQKIFGLFAEGW